MPRIITPSSTAWPPTGASLVASLRWSGAWPLVDGEALTSPMVSAPRRVPLARGEVAQAISWALSASDDSTITPSGSASAFTERVQAGPLIVSTRRSAGTSAGTVTVSTTAPSTVRRTGTPVAVAMPSLVTSTR